MEQEVLMWVGQVQAPPYLSCLGEERAEVGYEIQLPHLPRAGDSERGRGFTGSPEGQAMASFPGSQLAFRRLQYEEQSTESL